ncbi:hypothetical protein [Paraburkholderia sp. 22B1P]|uniref:hypothetical protein n=1 Tax=Paraburkholderia sp. 22B1P TaxID=3080498 RepID=UPI0030D26197
MVAAGKVGGTLSLTAALVISTGVFGAVTACWSLGHRALDEVAWRAGCAGSMANGRTR